MASIAPPYGAVLDDAAPAARTGRAAGGRSAAMGAAFGSGAITITDAPWRPWTRTPLAVLGWPRLLAARLAHAEIAVDLGDSIGSARWWRGFLTLGALAGGLASLLFSTPVLLAPVPWVPTPAAIEESRADAIAPLAQGAVTGRPVPPAPTVRRLSEVPERPRIELVARVGNGGLEGALRRAGVGADDLAALSGLLAGERSLSGLKPGTDLHLVLGRRETRREPRPIEELAFRSAFDMRLKVVRGEDGALALTRIPIKVDDRPLRITGEVGRSLERAARAAGVPAGIVSDYVRQMSYVLDFQREVRGRDRFEFIIAHRRAETGETEMGQLLYAGLDRGRDRIRLMRWGPKGEFFRANGEAAKKGMLRTPVDGARLSSNFGMRLHPILGYSRMHQGVDFAAPTGTPVLAAAAGRVTMAGWGGGYGNVVTIDHGRGYATRYAHLSRIQVKVGQQIGQGERLGAVGSTGMSTGPHLHYEVWQNGRPVNPALAKFAAAVQLGGSDLAAFRAEMERLERSATSG